ncbi:AraC family transcriptional regulator [Aquimarina sp. AD10]|uniref:helix-turn-helix transcriptional regulator n=1 Tax=Aquimarina sp. AD10 TaxID=1714849 RepID=UPI000E54E2D5|nr:helix-turn-helix transcriptional regulator [Aquimarina sp. AD10]AXT59679.1 AraC family transcriptional regulator [Aquimarina sp. AD10]RKM97555.1 helix-turn-helix domain-containing protein [Aquimarina sp. AD10]
MIALKTKEFLGKTTEQFSFGEYDISMVNYLQPVSEDWHSHEKYHLSLVLQGGNLESRKGQDIQILPGSIVLYDKEIVHRNRHTAFPSKNLNIEIDDDFFVKNELSTSDFQNSIVKNAEVQFGLLKIYKELHINDVSSAASIHTSLLTLFSDYNSVLNQRPPWVDKIREILCDRWDEFITLNELSNELNVHPVTISKYFSKYFKCSFGEYMRRIKIEKAILYLKHTDKSLTEITFLCGFSDQSHFSKIFKQNTGFKPNEFKHL